MTYLQCQMHNRKGNIKLTLCCQPAASSHPELCSIDMVDLSYWRTENSQLAVHKGEGACFILRAIRSMPLGLEWSLRSWKKCQLKKQQQKLLGVTAAVQLMQISNEVPLLQGFLRSICEHITISLVELRWKHTLKAANTMFI